LGHHEWFRKFASRNTFTRNAVIISIRHFTIRRFAFNGLSLIKQ
jgi:hypothetical protein